MGDSEKVTDETAQWLDLTQPVALEDWRPDSGSPRGPEVPQVGAVGRKI